MILYALYGVELAIFLIIINNWNSITRRNIDLTNKSNTIICENDGKQE